MRFLLFILLGFAAHVGYSQNDNNAIANAINQNNSSSITKYFDEDTDITVLEDNFSGVQGYKLVENFFNANKTSSFKIKHTGKSKSGNTYHIGDLKTASGNFRITYFTKKAKVGLKVIQFKIEEN